MVMALASFIGCNQQPAASLDVVSVFPTDGYHGFKKGDVITIEFNRPIDPASFTLAYASESEGLKPDQVNVSFAEDDTKVTIEPKQPLAYSPDDTYAYYSFEVGAKLVDQNGNHLTEPLQVTFSTLRTLKIKVLSVPELDGSGTGLQIFPSETVVFVGDTSGNVGVRGFLAFPWPDDAQEIAQAMLMLVCVSKQGSPFVSLGMLNIEPVSLGDDLQADDIYAPALASPISDDGVGWACNPDQRLHYDTTDFALTAWDEDLPRLDLRLRFDTATDSDDAADLVGFFARETEETIGPGLLPTLDLTYYGP